MKKVLLKSIIIIVIIVGVVNLITYLLLDRLYLKETIISSAIIIGLTFFNNKNKE